MEEVGQAPRPHLLRAAPASCAVSPFDLSRKYGVSLWSVPCLPRPAPDYEAVGLNIPRPAKLWSPLTMAMDISVFVMPNTRIRSDATHALAMSQLAGRESGILLLYRIVSAWV